MHRPFAFLARTALLAAMTASLAATAGAQSVQLATQASSVPEDGSTAQVRVTLSAAQAQDTTVTYALDGRATPGVDVLDLTAGSLVVPAGSSEGFIELQAVEDGLFERDETLEVRLLATSAGTLGPQVQHVLTVEEDGPVPTVAFANPVHSLIEGGAIIDVPLVLSGPADLTLAAQVELIGLAEPEDVTLASTGLVRFAPGRLTASLRIFPGDDALDEPEQRGFLGLQPLAPLTLGARSRVTLKLLDDDAPPTVSLVGGGGPLSEGAGAVQVTVELDAPSAKTVTVQLGSGAGTTASPGEDFQLPMSVVLAPGETSAAVGLQLLEDGLDEPDEVLVLRLDGASNAEIGGGPITWTLVDDDAPPSVAFTTAASSLTEGQPAPTLIGVTLLDAQGQPTVSGKSIDVALTTGGTADPVADVTGLPVGALQFAPGEGLLELALAAVDDSAVEGEETLELTLTTPDNATLGTPSVHVLTLVDDDVDPGVGEDFNRCGPDLPEGWEFVDPAGIGATRFVGAGTDDAGIALSIPAGQSLPIHTDLPPRLRRGLPTGDLALEVAFNTLIEGPRQMQGLLFEDGAGQWVRVDLSRTNTGTPIFFIGRDPVPGQSVTQIAYGSLNPEPLDGPRLRVSVQGTSWVVELWDGLDWYQPVPNCAFDLPGFAPTSLGLWAGNYGGGDGHEVVVDYVQESAAPLDPEDGDLPGGVGRTLSVVAVDGVGQPIAGELVSVTPEQPAYWCGETVSLTALDQPGWLFERWEGDLADPADALLPTIEVTLGVDRALTAVFAVDTSPPEIVPGSVLTFTGLESAVVEWSSSQLTESWLDYGAAGGALDTRIDSVPPGGVPQVDHAVVVTGLDPAAVYDFRITASNVNGAATAEGTLETETTLRFDFNTCDPADVLADWQLVDVAGDLQFSVAGGGTEDAIAVLEVPQGPGHPANAEALPPRLERSMGASLFEHEVIMASVPDTPTQLQGVIYRESSGDRWLGVFFQFVTGKVRYLIAFVRPEVPGGPLVLDAVTSGPIDDPISTLGLRVRRQADHWRMFRSQSGGALWQTMSQELGPDQIPSDFAPDRIGLIVADVAPSSTLPAPGAVAAYDSVRTYDPLDAWDDEDGTIGNGVANVLDIAITGAALDSGSGVLVEPGGAFLSEDGQIEYFCNQPVTLTAIAGPCEVFTGWQGDVSGPESSQQLVMDGPRLAIATFAPNLVGPVATGVTVSSYGTSLVVRWQTDEPATSRVDYGLSTTSLNNSVSSQDLVTEHEIFVDGLTPETTYFLEVSGEDACLNPYLLSGLQFDTGPVVPFEDEDFFAPNLALERWDWDDPTGGLAGIRVLDPGTADARVELELLAGVAYDSGEGGAAPTLGQTVSVGDLDLEARFQGALGQDGQRRGFQLREGAEAMEEVLLAVEGADLVLLSRTTANGVVQERSELVGDLASLAGQEQDLLLRVQFAVATSAYTATASLPDGTALANLVWTSGVLGQRVALTASNRPGTTPGQVVDVDFVRAGVLAGEDDPTTPETDLVGPWVYRAAASPSGDDSLSLEWSTEELATATIEYGTTAALGSATATQLLLHDHTLSVGGLAPDTTYFVRLTSQDVQGNDSAPLEFLVTTFPEGYQSPPEIRFWNARQEGAVWRRDLAAAGQGQDVLSIQGRATDQAGTVDSLQVRVNQGEWRYLAMGEADPLYAPPLDPDSRLGAAGDFNAELANDTPENQADPDIRPQMLWDLLPAPAVNLLEVRAVDDEGLERIERMEFTWEADPAPRDEWLPDWSVLAATGGSIDPLADPVDGEFRLDADPDPILGATVSNTEIAFDRLFALGDIGLTDYDVLVKARLDGLGPIEAAGAPGTNSYAFGLGLRWRGHFPRNTSEPIRSGYWDTGAFALWRGYPVLGGGPLDVEQSWRVYHKYRFGSNGQMQSSAVPAPAILPQGGAEAPVFWIRATVRTVGDNGRARYGFRAWLDGEPEPQDETGVIYVPRLEFNEWTPCTNGYDPTYDPETQDLSAFQSPQNGSLLFFLNHVRVKLGDVQLIRYPYSGYLLHEDFDQVYPTYGSAPSFQPLPGWVAETVDPAAPEPVWVVANRTGNPWFRHLLGTDPAFTCDDYGQYNFLGNTSALALIGSSLPGLTMTYQGTDATGASALTWSSYESTGRFYISNDNEVAGPIFLSDGTGNHYSLLKEGGAAVRLKRWSSGAGAVTFAGGTGVTTHKVDTNSYDDNQNGIHNWTRYRIQVTQEPTGTRVRARLWHAGDPEPGSDGTWDIDVLDDDPTRPVQGTVGFYGRAGGERFFDDVVVRPL